jgi:hypothetical protein
MTWAAVTAPGVRATLSVARASVLARSSKVASVGRVVLAQQRTKLVHDLLAIPDRVLLSAGQYPDRRGELAVVRDRSVRGQVGVQGVGQYQRVSGVVLGPADRVAVPIPRHRQRVDREQLMPRRTQGGWQQPLRRFDRDQDRCVAALAVFGQQLE